MGGVPSGIIFDRDGVLVNQIHEHDTMRPPWKPDEVLLSAGALEAVNRLDQLGISWSVASNQPDAARGRTSMDDLQAVNEQVADLLGTSSDRLFTCFHSGSEGCLCRKPRAGLLVEAMSWMHVQPSECWMIGDRWVDVAAAQEAGIRSVLIETNYSWKPTSQGLAPERILPTLTAQNVVEALASLLKFSANNL